MLAAKESNDMLEAMWTGQKSYLINCFDESLFDLMLGLSMGEVHEIGVTCRTSVKHTPENE